MKRFSVFLSLLLAALPCLIDQASAQTNNARMLSGVNTVSVLPYQFSPLDATRIVAFGSATPGTATLPPGNILGFGAGTSFVAQNLGAGTVTVVCSCLIFYQDTVGSTSIQIQQSQHVEFFAAGLNYNATISGGTGGTVTGTANQVNAASNIVSLSSTLLFPGTASAIQTGVFTNTQMNEYITGQIGGCNPATEFEQMQAMNHATDGMAGCVTQPLTSNVHQVNGISGYVSVSANSSNGSNNNGVGVYSNVRFLQNNTSGWLFNGAMLDLVGLTGHNMLGQELDVNVRGTPNRLQPFFITGIPVTGTMPPAPPLGSINGSLGRADLMEFLFNPAGNPWPAGLVTGPGTINGPAMQLDALCYPGPCASQFIYLNGFSNSSHANATSKIQSDQNGNLVLTPFTTHQVVVTSGGLNIPGLSSGSSSLLAPATGGGSAVLPAGSGTLCYTTTCSGTVSGQTTGQPTVGGSTSSAIGTSPQEVSVAAWCLDFTGSTCPGFADEAHAVRAVVANYGCTTAGGASCNIVDDMVGSQYWTEQPLPSNFTGQFHIRSNGPAHKIGVDGMSTVQLPGSTTFDGMGGTGSDQISENVELYMCNPLTDTCPGGGFQTQSTQASSIFAGTQIDLSVSGSVMTVTLQALAPFSTNGNAINQLAAGRWIQISGASNANDNGSFMVASVVSATAPQIFTLNIDSTTQATCAHPCGAAVATLETPLTSFGTGNGNGIFHTRMSNLILDGHGVLGGIAIVNGQGEEGTGTDGVIQMYNFPVGCLRLEQSGIFGGNGSIGTTNAGPYANLSCNFNPWIVTNAAGAPCSNLGVGTCSGGGNVPAGSAIAIGVGTLNFGVLTPSPIVNPNWWCVQVSGTNGNQGSGEIQRMTCSDQDKTQSAQGIFTANGASHPIALIVAGQHISFGDVHTEFVTDAAMICPDAAQSATVQETYGSVLTSGVNWTGGFVGFANGGLGIDIGQSGGGATCADINIMGVNVGNKTGTILKDNILGVTITGSVNAQSVTHMLGHGIPQGWYDSDPGVGIGTATLTLLGATSGSCPLITAATGGTLNICSTNIQATVAGAFTASGLGTFTGGASLGAGLVFSGASGAATTISTSASNADLLFAPQGTGRVVGPTGSTTTCGFCLTGSLTTGISAPTTNILSLIANGVEVGHVVGGMEIGDAASFKWSQTGAAGGTVGVALSAVGTGGTEAIQVAGTSTSDLLLLGTGNLPAGGNGCKVPTGGVTMSVSGTAVPFCTWTLPNSAQPWSWQCHGTYTTSTATDTLSLGVNAGAAPASSSRGEAMIYSTAAGTLTSGGANFTASGGTSIFTGASVSTVTDVPFEFHGVVNGAASSGSFSLTGALTGTSPSGTINFGTTCILY